MLYFSRSFWRVSAHAHGWKPKYGATQQSMPVHGTRHARQSSDGAATGTPGDCDRCRETQSPSQRTVRAVLALRQPAGDVAGSTCSAECNVHACAEPTPQRRADKHAHAHQIRKQGTHIARSRRAPLHTQNRTQPQAMTRCNIGRNDPPRHSPQQSHQSVCHLVAVAMRCALRLAESRTTLTHHAPSSCPALA
jgi:hypothetical protein